MLKSWVLVGVLCSILFISMVPHLNLAVSSVKTGISGVSTPRGIHDNIFFRNGQAWYFYNVTNSISYKFSNDGNSWNEPAHSPCVTNFRNTNTNTEAYPMFDVFYDEVHDAVYVAYVRQNDYVVVKRGTWSSVDADWTWGSAVTHNPYSAWGVETSPNVVVDTFNDRVIVSYSIYGEGSGGYAPRTMYNGLDLSGAWTISSFPSWDYGGLAQISFSRFSNATIYATWSTYASGGWIREFVARWTGTDWQLFGTWHAAGNWYLYSFYSWGGDVANPCQFVMGVSEINGELWIYYQKTDGALYRQKRGSTHDYNEELVVSGVPGGLYKGETSAYLWGANSSYNVMVYTTTPNIYYKVYNGASWSAAYVWKTAETGLFNGTLTHWGVDGVGTYNLFGWSRSSDNRFETMGMVPFNAPANIDVEIKDPETTGIDAGNWVFAQERFYNFSCLIYHGLGSSYLDTFLLGINDTVNFSSIVVDISAGTFRVDEGSQEPILVRAQTGSMLQSGPNYLYINVPVWFSDKIQDAYGNDNADLWMRCNDTNGLDTGWQLMEDNYMSIYNKGGFNLEYTTSGTAYRISGGDIFEFYSSDAGSVYSDYIWRNLQHVKFLVDAECIVGYPSFDVRYGIDFCLATSNWIRGWELKLHAIDTTYPGVGGGGNKHFTWNATWYYNQVEVRTDTIYMFHQGEIAAAGETTYARFWVDLWFNQVNSSSFFGGRVNAYAYPVKDGAAWYMRWLSTSWGVDENLPKESMFFGQLHDDDGNVVHANQVKLVKLWAKLQTYHVAADIQEARLFRYEVFDKTMCNPPLTGIPTPTFEESKVPVMPQGGFVGAIVSALTALGKWLADNVLWGGLGIFPALVGFLDTVAAVFGAPHFFSNLFTWIANGLTYLATSVTYFFELVVQLFLLLSTVMASFVYLLTQIVLSFVNTITGIQNLMSGAVGAGGNMWNDLGISTWIVVGLVFYPLYLLILWEEEGSEPVLAQLSLIFGVAVGLFHFVATLIGLVANMIFGLIEAIPIAE